MFRRRAGCTAVDRVIGSVLLYNGDLLTIRNNQTARIVDSFEVRLDFNDDDGGRPTPNNNSVTPVLPYYISRPL